jgi:hypothetical protein
MYKISTDMSHVNYGVFSIMFFVVVFVRLFTFAVFWQVSRKFKFAKALQGWQEFFTTFFSGLVKGPMTLIFGTKYLSNGM